MAKQTQQPVLPPRLMSGLVKQARAERYWQRQVWRGEADAHERPRPLEFDALGFPVPQSRPGFLRRVGRLLGDG